MTKHRAMFWLLISVLIVVGFTATYFAKVTHAQQSNLGLQKLGETHEGTTIYRMTADGCELFIAERLENNTNHSPASVSLATGRGCK